MDKEITALFPSIRFNTFIESQQNIDLELEISDEEVIEDLEQAAMGLYCLRHGG